MSIRGVRSAFQRQLVLDGFTLAQATVLAELLDLTIENEDVAVFSIRKQNYSARFVSADIARHVDELAMSFAGQLADDLKEQAGLANDQSISDLIRLIERNDPVL